MFSEFDLVRLHIENETKIFANNPEGEMPFFLKKQADDDWKLKCEYEGYQNTPPLTKKNFMIEMPVLLAKRSCQQKVVEFMVLKMFSK